MQVNAQTTAFSHPSEINTLIKVLMAASSCTAEKLIRKLIWSLLSSTVRGLNSPACYQEVNIYLIRGLLGPELSSSSREEEEGGMEAQSAASATERQHEEREFKVVLSARCNALWHISYESPWFPMNLSWPRLRSGALSSYVCDSRQFGAELKTNKIRSANWWHICHPSALSHAKTLQHKHAQTWFHKWTSCPFHVDDKCGTTFRLVYICKSKPKHFLPKGDIQ